MLIYFPTCLVYLLPSDQPLKDRAVERDLKHTVWALLLASPILETDEMNIVAFLKFTFLYLFREFE